MLFSIADIQNDPEEDFEDDAEAEKAEDEGRDEPVLHTFPIRVALTMTKVFRSYVGPNLHLLSEFVTCCAECGHGCTGG